MENYDKEFKYENDNIKLLKVSKPSIEKYRNLFNGCKELSDEQVQKKLNRNIIISHLNGCYNIYENGKTFYRYGYMGILVFKDLIVNVKKCDKNVSFNKYKGKDDVYEALNEYLGIDIDSQIRDKDKVKDKVQDGNAFYRKVLEEDAVFTDILNKIRNIINSGLKL